MSIFDPNNPDVTINIQPNYRNDEYTIKVAMRNLHEMTAVQADTYLKELIARTLKTAVQQHYPAIQRLVDEAIHADGMRAEVEKIVRETIAKMAEQTVKEMFE